MGTVGKSIGDSFDPMTGRFNPAGLFVPQVRENNQQKRALMTEEIKSSESRRRLGQFARTQAVLDNAEATGKAVDRGQLMGLRRETIQSAGGGRAGRIEARASGLGLKQIGKKLEDYSENERRLIAAKAELRDTYRKQGWGSMDALVDLFGKEELQKAGLDHYSHWDSASAQIEVLNKNHDLSMDEAHAKDTIAREYLKLVTTENMKRDLYKAGLKRDESLMKDYLHGLNRVEDFDDFMRREKVKRRSAYLKDRRGGADKNRNLSNADLQTVRGDLVLALAEISPDMVTVDADGQEQPQPKLAHLNTINRTSYLVQELLEQGASPMSASAVGRTALMSQGGRGPLSIPSPLKKQSGIFSSAKSLLPPFLGGQTAPGSMYTASEEDLAKTAQAFSDRLNEQGAIQRDPVARRYGMPSPEVFFLQVNRAIQEAGIPAELGRDAEGHIRFLPKEGFAQSGIPEGYLDQLTQILFDFMERDAGAETPRKRRAKAG